MVAILLRQIAVVTFGCDVTGLVRSVFLSPGESDSSLAAWNETPGWHQQDGKNYNCDNVVDTRTFQLTDWLCLTDQLTALEYLRTVWNNVLFFLQIYYDEIKKRWVDKEEDEEVRYAEVCSFFTLMFFSFCLFLSFSLSFLSSPFLLSFHSYNPFSPLSFPPFISLLQSFLSSPFLLSFHSYNPFSPLSLRYTLPHPLLQRTSSLALTVAYHPSPRRECWVPWMKQLVCVHQSSPERSKCLGDLVCWLVVLRWLCNSQSAALAQSIFCLTINLMSLLSCAWHQEAHYQQVEFVYCSASAACGCEPMYVHFWEMFRQQKYRE